MNIIDEIKELNIGDVFVSNKHVECYGRVVALGFIVEDGSREISLEFNLEFNGLIPTPEEYKERMLTIRYLEEAQALFDSFTLRKAKQ